MLRSFSEVLALFLLQEINFALQISTVLSVHNLVHRQHSNPLYGSCFELYRQPAGPQQQIKQPPNCQIPKRTNQTRGTQPFTKGLLKLPSINAQRQIHLGTTKLTLFDVLNTMARLDWQVTDP